MWSKGVNINTYWSNIMANLSKDSSSKMQNGEHSEGFTLESQRSRQLIDKLREHGLDKHIELPQVAIMGDTSSGKSSVLSALSGISFPSSDKLTTRCPTQLIMTHADEPFSGIVTLRRSTPNSNEKINPTQITSVEEITGHIEKLTQKLVDEGQKISDDSIVIQISGPQLPNFTLIDLPGLVRTVETGEDKSIIARIRALVTRYLEQKRTIILAVVPGNVDMHNTEILQAAEEADPDGNRTQAIITKLDLIDPGAEQSVLELLQNRVKKLKLGYHAVKCRGQKELNDKVSIADGIKKETTYFKESPIWSKVSSHLTGINQLRQKLVMHLENIIIRELPSVIAEIETREGACQGKLASLGPSMDSKSARRAYYSKVVDSYFGVMEAASKGNYNVCPSFFQSTEDEAMDNRFRAIIRLKEEVFQMEIHNLLHNREYETTKQLNVGDLVEVKEGGGEFNFQGTVVLVDPYNTFVLLDDGSEKLFGRACEFRVRTLDKIKKLIKANRGDELTIFPSYSVFCSIVQNYIQSWEEPMINLSGHYMTSLAKVSERAILHCPSKDTVKRHFQSTISTVMTSLEKQTSNKLDDKLVSEKRPYTMNHYLFDIIIKLRHKPLLDAVKNLPGPEVSKDTVLAILNSHGVKQSSNEDYVAIETENAVIAYLKVASKRFIDEIPILLNDKIQESFLNVVKEALSVTDEGLSMMLAEDPATLQERKDLEEELCSLLASRHEISRDIYNA